MKKRNDLEKIRKQIDETDIKILSLLNKRAGLAKKTTALKEDIVFDPKREKQVLSKLTKINKGPIEKRNIEEIYLEILNTCREIQNPTKIAYLGPPGSNTQEAVLTRFGEKTITAECTTISDVFETVQSKEQDFGVVPIENSLEGPIGETLDNLIKTSVSVVGEFSKKINHTLLSNEKSMKKIKTVYSHPQAIAQCKTWLYKNLPNTSLKESSSTSEAARIVAKQKETASISPLECSNLYSLNVLKKSIQDEKNNSTIFIVLAPEIKMFDITKNSKLSIAFTLDDQPGSLFKCLKPFKDSKINLTKIQSRPSKRAQWDYLFFVDILVENKVVQTKAAINEIKRQTSYFKVLGVF
mgnify:FL=1